MGLPFFTWRPHQTRQYKGDDRLWIDLPEELSDLQVNPRRDVFDTFSIYGGRSREYTRSWLDVRIVLDRFNDRALFRQFSAMINHLERGGVVAFGTDSEKCYASSLFNSVNPGAVAYRATANAYKEYHPSAPDLPTNGDEMVIESPPPKSGREYFIFKNATETAGGYKITVGDDGTYNKYSKDFYPDGSRVRIADFFPTLILPPGAVGAQMLTHDHRISYTLDLNLVLVGPKKKISQDTGLVQETGPNGNFKDPNDQMV